MKQLISNEINAIEDLMHFKVFNSQLESIFTTHRVFDEEMEEWGETTIDLPYEDIDDYLLQNNRLVDGATGTILRVGNNLVVYLK